MESIDYWRFCNNISVVQAALLIVGCDPTLWMDYVRQLKSEEQPKGFVAVLTALQNDVGSSWLEAQVKRVALSYGDVGDDTDWDQTLISVRDLKDWLKERGVSTGFFFPEGPVSADYLNSSDPNFSSKLAASVEAWKAVKAARNLKPSGKSARPI